MLNFFGWVFVWTVALNLIDMDATWLVELAGKLVGGLLLVWLGYIDKEHDS